MLIFIEELKNNYMPTIITFGLGEETEVNNLIITGPDLTVSNCNIDVFLGIVVPTPV